MIVSMVAERAHRKAAALLHGLSAQVPGVIFQLRLDRAGRLLSARNVFDARAPLKR